MVSVKKWLFFILFFFSGNTSRPGTSVLRYSRTKKRLSRLLKQEVKKSKN